MQKHIDHSITWIDSDEAFTPLQWVHLPRHQIIGGKCRSAWVFRPSCGWVEISSGENIRLCARYQSSEILVKRLVERYTFEVLLKKMEDYAKRSRADPKRGTVEHTIRKQEFSLPNNLVPVTKSRLKSLELENQEIKLTICALNSELEEAKRVLA